MEYGINHTAKVLKVINGDTLIARLPNNSTAQIDIACIDAPATSPDAYFNFNSYFGINDTNCLARWGSKAKIYTMSVLEGRTVQIEFDNMQMCRANNTRLYAYVYVDSKDFGAELLKAGYVGLNLRQDASNTTSISDT
ncbi:MAG: micrococcal nuclease [Archaeoglobaceae archaeon]|nr:micrococcal nuclease [Archaeoglobaceae archaeon]